MAPERRDGHGPRPGRAPSGPRPARSAPQRQGAPAHQQAEREAVLAVVTPLVEAAGLDIEDVEVRAVGRRRVVRVLVDGDDGVSLDQVAQVSRTIADVMDTSDVLGDQAYTLEVSSPGVDRPLTAPRHWRRNVHRLVGVNLVTGEAFTGRIVSVTEDDALLEVAGADRRVLYRDVRRAVVQVEFNHVDAGEDTDIPEDDLDESDG